MARIGIIQAAVAALLHTLAPAAQAQMTDSCEWLGAQEQRAQARARLFANGNVKLVHVPITGEACCSDYVVVVIEETGTGRVCQAISAGSTQTGFSDVDLAAVRSRYDPAWGLTLTVPVRVDDQEPFDLEILINQAHGAIDVTIAGEPE